ncbi:cytochrome P450 monooxygenase CYP4G7, partial [Asbolus verrucosus]
MSVTEEPLGLTLNLGSSHFYFLLLITGLLVLYRYSLESLRYVILGSKLPGIDTLQLLKNVHLFSTKPNSAKIMKLAVELFANRGKVIKLWLGRRLTVVLQDPRDVELILGSNVHLEKSVDYKFFEPWLGEGDKWKAHRKMIAPTFHQTILKTFVPVFNKNANELVEQLRKDTLREICDIHDYMSSATVDVLLETVMGVKKTKEAKSSFRYAKAVMDMCTILHFRHARPWMTLDFIFSFTKMFRDQTEFLKIIHSLTDKVIKRKKKDYFDRTQEGESSLYNIAVKETEEDQKKGQQGHNFGSALRDDLDENDESVGEKKRLAFLDFMVEASQTEGNKLSDEEIREEVNTIMFEGHDTTAAASSFFLCLLGVYPEIQERVYQELKDIFQDSDRSITFNDTLEMKYLERVLLETIRMYPPVPIITRVINEEVQL